MHLQMFDQNPNKCSLQSNILVSVFRGFIMLISPVFQDMARMHNETRARIKCLNDLKYRYLFIIDLRHVCSPGKGLLYYAFFKRDIHTCNHHAEGISK